MSDTFSNLLAHIIFSTKNREPYITSDLKPQLYSYIGGILRNIECTLLDINGVSDHLHLLVRYPPRMAMSDIVRTVKSNSSKWAREELAVPFGWQSGGALLSVSESIVPDIRAYLDRQEEHHRRVSFREEFVEFLRRNRIEFEERYLD
jgi:putative transposase